MRRRHFHLCPKELIMNRHSEKEARMAAGAGPVFVYLRSRVLEMENSALNSLHNNALRLSQSGDSKQKLAAADLLPVIEAELARRAALKRPKSASKAATARKSKAKEKPEPEAEEEPEMDAELE